ncbi:cytochrome ubiquinol oxidase subunit I [Fulvivirgaceae bacterium BMA10]|uniref:Cytochrome ubiquinol oxidase subunit I n=1 Tax=Splendidivirga corallicola TaxID=3051826 RepID=A0ABT8KLY4_9BACT|nr:cytochrome ubiquinol oxidase subunit I [Fulvivirgaceae bacterium BMA10]
MENLFAARSQMAVSLGFHIVFACIGMVMPFLMALSHFKWLKTGQEIYKDLTKAWSRGVAIFFATGAVSGTVLSFELGLLWPSFMEHAGPIIGMPFSLEGTAFFVEAIALGFFLYGWDRMNKWLHWAMGLLVGISGVASGILVVAANAWMNSPSGFDWVNGEALNIRPIEAMFNEAWFTQALHMTLAAFVATGFAVAGIHALLLLKQPNNTFHRKAVRLAMYFGAFAAILQPISGDLSAKDIADRQPEKLAALEALYKTSQPADLIIGGLPNDETEQVDYAIHIPGLLSFLAHGDFNAEVKGLDIVPKSERPPVLITHLAFQIMVGIGSFLFLVAILYLFFSWKKPHHIWKKWFLRITAISAPLGFIAVEAGWVVTEVGRQPWIIYKVMKTSEAVTPMPGIQYSLLFTTLIYLILTFLVFWLMKRQIKALNNSYQSANQ